MPYLIDSALDTFPHFCSGQLADDGLFPPVLTFAFCRRRACWFCSPLKGAVCGRFLVLFLQNSPVQGRHPLPSLSFKTQDNITPIPRGLFLGSSEPQRSPSREERVALHRWGGPSCSSFSMKGPNASFAVLWFSELEKPLLVLQPTYSGSVTVSSPFLFPMDELPGGNRGLSYFPRTQPAFPPR